jgi:hypothetical protein
VDENLHRLIQLFNLQWLLQNRDRTDLKNPIEDLTRRFLFGWEASESLRPARWKLHLRTTLTDLKTNCHAARNWETDDR